MNHGSGMPETSTAGRGISRRTVTRGVAWSAPLAAISVAAPAYASSIPCQVQTNFDNLTPGQPPGVLTFLPSTIKAAITYASTGNGGDPTPGDTGEVAATSTVPPWNYIEVEMLQPLGQGDTVTVIITLTAPVTNLSFRIHDIDKTAQGWNDHVIVNTVGFTYVRGTNVIGAGTDADPFRNTVVGDQAINSGLNHVDLKWAGPLSQVQFTYRAGMTGNSGNQHIGLGNISFSDCVANPNLRSAARTVNLGAQQFVPSKGAALVEGRDN
jgi:hypothetical protein